MLEKYEEERVLHYIAASREFSDANTKALAAKDALESATNSLRSIMSGFTTRVFMVAPNVIVTVEKRSTDHAITVTVREADAVIEPAGGAA